MTGTGFTTAGYYIGTSGVSVSAADLTYGDFKYWVQSDNTIIISEYIGEGDVENLIIPSKIDGKTVSKIGYWRSGRYYSLENITIPASVKSLGGSVFYGCSRLQNITIQTKLLTDKNVGANAFKNIDKMPTVRCPKGMVNKYKKLLLKKGMPKNAIFK